MGPRAAQTQAEAPAEVYVAAQPLAAGWKAVLGPWPTEFRPTPFAPGVRTPPLPPPRPGAAPAPPPPPQPAAPQTAGAPPQPFGRPLAIPQSPPPSGDSLLDWDKGCQRCWDVHSPEPAWLACNFPIFHGCHNPQYQSLILYIGIEKIIF